MISGDFQGHVASARDIVLAVEKMKARVLDRLCQDPRITELNGIFKAVEEGLNGGYIWSVSDLHLWLEKAVQVSIISLSIVASIV